MAITGPAQIDIQAGGTNLHYGRIAFWLAVGLTKRLPDGSVASLRIGNAFRDLSAVGAGLAQVGVTTPAVAAFQALHGLGRFERAYPELRSIGVVPHRDGLIFGVANELQVASIREIHQKRLALRLVVRDERYLTGYGTLRALEEHGITPDSLAGWGGQWIDVDNSQVGWRLVADGKADAFCDEAVAMAWRPLCEARPMRLLSMEPDALDRLHQKYGYTSKVMQAGTCAGQDEPVICLNWDHWIVVVHSGVDDQIAACLAETFLEDTGMLSRQYTADGQLPYGHHPLDYPIRPEAVANEVTIPLHPGAARRYRLAGVVR